MSERYNVHICPNGTEWVLGTRRTGRDGQLLKPPISLAPMIRQIMAMMTAL